MTVTLKGAVIVLSGPCRVEDAEPLTALLQASPEATVDISACDTLHSAVVQALLAFTPRLKGVPADPFLALRLSPALGRM